MTPLLTLFGCRSLQTFDTPIEPDYAWERAEPDATWAARFEAAQAYHESQVGLGMLVIQGDTILFEQYANGHSASTPGPLWSGTKTFACALAMEGVEQELLTLDEAVGDTLADFAEGEKADITLRQLLNFTSGLKKDRRNLSRDGFFAPEDQRIEDKYQHARDLPLTSEPGAVYEYGSQHLMVFGAVMKEKLGQDPLPWLTDEVLDPIGLRTSGWSHDLAGNSMWPYGAWTTVSEWARFGVLLRDDGLWQGERVLPEGTLDACRTGSEPNPAYGLGSWLNREVPEDLDLSRIGHFEEEGPIIYADGSQRMLVAAGARGQRIYILPEEDMVVVLQTDSPDFADPVFLELLLSD